MALGALLRPSQRTFCIHIRCDAAADHVSLAGSHTRHKPKAARPERIPLMTTHDVIATLKE